MKYSLIALAATAICGASAASHNHRRHNHGDIFKRYEQKAEDCKCSTYVTSYVVPVTVYPSTTVTVVPVYETDSPKATPTYGSDSPVGTPACADGMTGPGCPAGETPVYGTPEECGEGMTGPNCPAVETPVYDTPKETPVYGTPEECGEGMTGPNCPAVETPVYDTPKETPVYGTPEECGEGMTGPNCPAGETPVYSTPSYPAETPVGTPVYSTESPEEVTTTTYVTSVQTSTAVEYETATEYEPVPTPEVVTYTQPGTYTIPAKTKVITATETAVYPETTVLVPGKTETYGGVTTIVETSTVVTCPYVAVETSEGVTTSKIYETVYECPTAGTYTIGAYTTVPTETTTVEYGIPTEYAPGTYVQPEITTTITKTDVVVTCPYETIHPTETPAVPEYTAPAEVETPVYTPKETPVYTPKETPVYTPKETPVYTPKETPVYTPKETPSYEETTPEEPEEPVSVEKPVYTPKATTSVYKPTTSSYVPKETATPKVPTGGSGKYWAITYSPYSDDGTCKPAADVASDIADIASKGFSNVRIYSTECDGLKNVGDACRANNVGMIVGLFIKAGGVSTCAQDLEDLVAWNGWDMVQSVIVGNEAVFNGYVTAPVLVDYISTVRKALKDGPGYTGPISTAETVGILEKNPELCAACDFVGVNIQPYFDGQRTAEQAGSFLKSQLEQAQNACGGKEGYVLEAGWPSAGNPNGAAIASPENQKIAVSSYEENAPGHIAYFTYRNDKWKAPGIEQNFGCATVL